MAPFRNWFHQILIGYYGSHNGLVYARLHVCVCVCVCVDFACWPSGKPVGDNLGRGSEQKCGPSRKVRPALFASQFNWQISDQMYCRCRKFWIELSFVRVIRFCFAFLRLFALHVLHLFGFAFNWFGTWCDTCYVYNTQGRSKEKKGNLKKRVNQNRINNSELISHKDDVSKVKSTFLSTWLLRLVTVCVSKLFNTRTWTSSKLWEIVRLEVFCTWDLISFGEHFRTTQINILQRMQLRKWKEGVEKFSIVLSLQLCKSF